MGFSAPTPDTLLSDIVTELNIHIQWVEQCPDPQRVAEFSEEVCLQYRALAICLFAGDADIDEFFHYLLHSPLTRKVHLVKARQDGQGESATMRASFVEPVLDAMAARQWKLAADVSGLSAPAWMEGSEYEDDFCYADFLRRLLQGQEDSSIGEVLARWRRALESGVDQRLDVAESLLARDAVTFEENLRALLRRREEEDCIMANPETRSQLASELPFFPNRWISIEGLALLALGERRGLVVEEDIEACPRIARDGRYAAFVMRGYPNQTLE